MKQDGLKETNHYLSRSFLKNFVNSQKKINIYNLLVPRENFGIWIQSSVGGTAYRKNLYTYLSSNGLTDEFETWFNEEIEDPAAASIKKVLSDAQLSPEDWKKLIRFAAALDLRSPARMLQYFKESEKTLPDSMKNILQTLLKEYQLLSDNQKMNIPPPQKDDLFQYRVLTKPDDQSSIGKIGIEIPLNRSQWLGQLRHRLTSTYKVLLKHRWTILKPANGIAWFTTDCPVIRLNYYRKGHYDFKGGWGNPGGKILLPLSPNHLLYTKIGNTRPPRRGTLCSVEFTNTVRQFIAQHAYRFIYSTSADSEIPKLHPRTVDMDKYNREKLYWNKWHDYQLASEKEYRD